MKPYSDTSQNKPEELAIFPSLTRPSNLADTIAIQLRDSIFSGHLSAGARLAPEQTLAAQFGVSRNIVREAMAQLKLSGYIQTRHGVGSFVTSDLGQCAFELSTAEVLTLEQLEQVHQLRVEVESGAAALAAKMRTPKELKEIQLSLTLNDEARHNWKQATETALDFHMSIAKATHNSYFVRLLAHMRHVLRDAVKTMRIRNIGSKRIDQVTCEHRLIVDAIEQRDSDGARHAMRTHLNNGLDYYKQNII